MTTRPDLAEPLSTAQLRETADYFEKVAERFRGFANAIEKDGKSGEVFPSVKTLRRALGLIVGIVGAFEKVAYPDLKPPTLARLNPAMQRASIEDDAAEAYASLADATSQDIAAKNKPPKKKRTD